MLIAAEISRDKVDGVGGIDPDIKKELLAGPDLFSGQWLLCRRPRPSFPDDYLDLITVAKVQGFPNFDRQLYISGLSGKNPNLRYHVLIIVP
jgi:hypothetical protein